MLICEGYFFGFWYYPFVQSCLPLFQINDPELKNVYTFE